MTLQIRSVIFLRIVTIEKRNYCFPCNYSVQPMICGKTFVSRHCEPVTDVTGVAIRIPLTRLNCLNCTKEKRIPTPVLRHWLGMTG